MSRHATLRRRQQHKDSQARESIRQFKFERFRVAPDTVLRCAETYSRFPRERWLCGSYDLYHQFRFDSDPEAFRAVVWSSLRTLTLSPRFGPVKKGTLHPRAGRLVRRAAAVCAVSEVHPPRQCMNTLAFPLDRIHVVPNGVDTVAMNPTSAMAALPQAREQLKLPERYLLGTSGEATTRKT